MSTYIVAFAVAIWDWVIAPPINWLLSLSLEWRIELGALLVCTFFCIPIIENLAIGRERAGEWWSERKRRREWYYYARMEAGDFRALVSSIRRLAERQVRLAERLEGRSSRGFLGEILRLAAWRRQKRAEALHAEADRLERLWKAIEKERGSQGDSAATRAKVLGLMRRLDSLDDRAANGALGELKRIGNWFDWEGLAPKEMAPPQRERLVKLLRLMAGTTSLDEARNAYHTAFRMLQERNWDRQWEAA
jgi:hypothetical protein